MNSAAAERMTKDSGTAEIVRRLRQDLEAGRRERDRIASRLAACEASLQAKTNQLQALEARVQTLEGSTNA